MLTQAETRLMECLSARTEALDNHYLRLVPRCLLQTIRQRSLKLKRDGREEAGTHAHSREEKAKRDHHKPIAQAIDHIQTSSRVKTDSLDVIKEPEKDVNSEGYRSRQEKSSRKGEIIDSSLDAKLESPVRSGTAHEMSTKANGDTILQ
ncbi:hypothetical protein PoB_000302000 [Plakobranchus ocellatus]|uniref:Uncharacterized protein n=1 Tax=Plakobranchus ocellatus TaxID=259542 RepID=A0AAV3Y0T4_9GAST|nr:hypothetical protein PoB_000302000 [Plakobranchus ocellatus]